MLIRILIAGLLLAGVASAQRVPKGTFNASQFAEAKAEAIEEGKNIAVIYTEIDSTCPKCRFGTEAAFKRMRSDYVLVLEDKRLESETGTLPKDIKTMTYATYKEKGNFLPIITVFSPDASTVLSGACYDQIAADERKWLKDIESEIASKSAASDAGTESESTPAEEEPSTEASGDLKEWTDLRGRTLKGEFVHADILSVTLRLESGNQVDIPLAKLSPESRALVEECR